MRNYQYSCANIEAIDDRKCNNNRISLIILNHVVERTLEKQLSSLSMKQKDLVAVSNRKAEAEKRKMEA